MRRIAAVAALAAAALAVVAPAQACYAIDSPGVANVGFAGDMADPISVSRCIFQQGPIGTPSWTCIDNVPVNPPGPVIRDGEPGPMVSRTGPPGPLTG